MLIVLSLFCYVWRLRMSVLHYIQSTSSRCFNTRASASFLLNTTT